MLVLFDEYDVPLVVPVLQIVLREILAAFLCFRITLDLDLLLSKEVSEAFLIVFIFAVNQILLFALLS